MSTGAGSGGKLLRQSAASRPQRRQRADTVVTNAFPVPPLAPPLVQMMLPRTLMSASSPRPARAAARWRAAGALATLLALRARLPSDPTGPPARVALLVRADVSGTPVATLVAEVTAPDIAPPLVFTISAAGGVAQGSLVLPVGPRRTVTLRAYDAAGVETNAGSVTAAVQPGSNPTIAVVLMPLI